MSADSKVKRFKGNGTDGLRHPKSSCTIMLLTFVKRLAFATMNRALAPIVTASEN
jgi:hypothetical protein